MIYILYNSLYNAFLLNNDHDFSSNLKFLLGVSNQIELNGRLANLI